MFKIIEILFRKTGGMNPLILMKFLSPDEQNQPRWVTISSYIFRSLILAFLMIVESGAIQIAAVIYILIKLYTGMTMQSSVHNVGDYFN